MMPSRRMLLATLFSVPAMVAAPHCLAAPRGVRTGIPSGYLQVANEFRMPAPLLYGIALQESVMWFGEPRTRRPLPWPWTLNIAGTPTRLRTRDDAEQRLHDSLRRGVDSVDVGPMGINWRYHQQRLLSVERALDPYWNLRVGAGLLAEHFARCGSWPEAVGRYHAPAHKARAAAYSASVFARLRKLGHV